MPANFTGGSQSQAIGNRASQHYFGRRRNRLKLRGHEVSIFIDPRNSSLTLRAFGIIGILTTENQAFAMIEQGWSSQVCKPPKSLTVSGGRVILTWPTLRGDWSACSRRLTDEYPLTGRPAPASSAWPLSTSVNLRFQTTDCCCFVSMIPCPGAVRRDVTKATVGDPNNGNSDDGNTEDRRGKKQRSL